MQKEEQADRPTETRTSSPERFRDKQMALIRLFIELATAKVMDRREIVEKIYKMEKDKFITGTDVEILIRELNEALGTTPEQIRVLRVGHIRLLIEEAKGKRIDPSQVSEMIFRDRANNSITDEDTKILTNELYVALGITPEQIRENKIRLIKLFIQLAKDVDTMAPEFVLERINQVKNNGSISETDAMMLQNELHEALGLSE